MSRGTEIADSALHILATHDTSLADATERLARIAGSKEDMREAIAYLACQTWTYRRMSDEDAHLALVQVESTIARYRERKGRVDAER